MDTNICSSETSSPPWSIDELEQILIDEEREIAKHRATQLAVLEILDRAQVATADGSRTLVEWVTARIDLAHETSRGLVRTMRRTADRPWLREALISGATTFDRIDAVARVGCPGPDPVLRHLDVPGVLRLAAYQSRAEADATPHSALDNYVVIQPTLDQTWWRLWGGLDGVTGAIVDRAINDAADRLPAEAPRDGSWRRAMGLAQLCLGDEVPAPTGVSVFIDADVATHSNGEAGVYLEAGPRVGRDALDAILCDSVLEVTVTGSDGQPMRYGRRARIVPPALRRAVIHRDGNRCAIEGCASRNRLQVHHITPWTETGPTDPENLITVCWFHHHVAIHHQHLVPRRHPDHGRWQLRRAHRGPPS